MTQTVTVPGVGDLDFPDGMSQQDMANAIKHNFPEIHQKQAPPKEERTFMGEVSKGFQREAFEKEGGLIGGAVGAAAAGTSYGMEKLGQTVGKGYEEISKSLGASPETASTIGKVASFAPDIALGGGAGGAVGKAAGTGIARSLMQSALKPLKEARESGRAAKAIDLMLEKGINVSEGGVEKLRGMIDKLNQEVKQRIASSTLSVSKKKVVATLDDLTQRLKNQVTPQGDLNAVKKAWNDFWNHPDLKGRATIPVQKAQELKQGTYRELRGKYGEEKAASIESQKALARGLKEQIEKAHPEIGPLNAEETKLINALDLTEQRVLAEMNKNPGGLTWLTHNPKAAVAFMADRSGPFKSLMARLINRTGKTTGQVVGGATAVAGQQALSARPAD